MLAINNPWIKHKQCHGLKFSSSALNIDYALFDIRYMLPFFYLRWTHLYWLQSDGESKTPVGWNKQIIVYMYLGVLAALCTGAEKYTESSLEEYQFWVTILDPNPYRHHHHPLPQIAWSCEIVPLRKVYLASHHDEGNCKPITLEDLFVWTDKGQIESHWRRGSHGRSSKSNKAAGLYVGVINTVDTTIFMHIF